MLSSPAPTLIQSGTFSPLVQQVKLRCIVVSATFTACLGALSFGYVLAYSSPVEMRMKESFGWSNNSFTWFSGVSGLGALVGSNLGSYSLGKFGRKLTIMLCSVPFVTGWVMIAGAKSSALAFTGRVITGLAVGAISLTVPVYIAEISPAKFRGLLGSCNQLAVTLGALICYSIGAATDNWRWLAVIGAVPPTLMMILITFMPETPSWLIQRRRVSEAIQVLHLLRGGRFEDCEQECHDIEDNLGSNEKASLSDFKTRPVYRPLILAVLLMVFQQLSGINVIISYASEILEAAGFKNANEVSIIIAAVQVVATGISCLIVDKLGRRILLIIPGIVMALSMALLGASEYSNDLHQHSYVALLAMILFITGFSFGWGPIPWLAMSEIFPARVRGICAGIATMVNWLFVFLVTKTYNEIKADIDTYGTYWFYGGVCLLSAIYVFVFLPETKGLALEETERLFAHQEVSS